MKKLFGEYLIEKKLATTEQVLSALIEQIRGLPSICEIIYDNGLMPKEEIIKMLAHQIKNSTDFKGACVANGLWNEKLSSEVEKTARSKRKPLGEILIRNQVITAEALTSALDNFLTENVKKDTSIHIHPEFIPVQRDLVAIKNASPGSGEITQRLTASFHLIHKIRGMARMRDAEKFENLLMEFESLFEKELENKNLNVAEFIVQAEKHLHLCSEMAGKV